MNSNFKIFLKGIVDVSPLMIPVVPFGLIFGVLAIDIGFTPLETMGMSLIVFGGASQIVLLQLFSGGASSLVIISSVGAVNSRHLLYGAVVSEHLSDLKLIWKIIISYFLIDQAFAISNEYLKKNEPQTISQPSREQTIDIDEEAGLTSLDGLVIETAVRMGEKAFVTINGQTFREGDLINDALIEKIENEQITFKVGKTRIIKDVGT